MTDDIARLRLDVPALPPTTTVDAAADIFLLPENARMLSLPIAENGIVIGTISRHTLNGIFLRRFGRELYGMKSITQIMNRAPLVVDERTALEGAAAYVTAHLGSPITEDFVVVRDGRYVGMGVVLDLLSALSRRVDDDTRQLRSAFRELKASQTQLVQSEKMASLGQMVAGVAHEINTPLGYVRNNLEMIQDIFERSAHALRTHERLTSSLLDESLDEALLTQQLADCREAMTALGDTDVLDDARTLCADSLHGVDSIRDLVVNLRNFSRLDQARVAEISLNDCIDQTLVIVNNVLKTRVQIIKRYGEIPKVRCSPSQINQVLMNLITNAAQAIEHDDGKLLLKTEADGERVRIHVQDNGKGIAPEHLKQIFDPFFTTKPVGQGTGLGLSIAFKIVQAHGGDLRVVSEPGRGTKFVISLPLTATATDVDALAA